MRHTHPSYDAIIAGAGPVGLFLACELALARCSVLVLEREADPHSPFKQLPFGLRGLSAPTVEALYRRGLLERLVLPQRLPHAFAGGAAAGHFAGIPLRAGLVDSARWPWRLPGGPETSLAVELAALEALLARRALSLGVTIRRGLAVEGVAQDEEGVSVDLGGETVRGRWLVGCDGARSRVRKAAGIGFAGTEPEFTGYSLRLELEGADQLGAGRRLTPAGLYFQSQPGFLALQEFDGGAGHGAGPLTREQVQAVLRRVTGTDASVRTLHAATTWTDRARQAVRYRQGRVLLAGDAAHIHAPLGGQGLNLGIGDAMNLGWKLAATIHGSAPADLLDSYEAERHPVGAAVLDWSRAQVVIMRPDPASRALRAIVEELAATRDGATHLVSRLRGVTLRYPLAGEHPLVGRSVPDFAFADGLRLGQRMRDGSALLLDFGRDEGLRALAARAGGRLAYLALAPLDALGLGALLVRPDGIVAWACDAAPAQADADADAAQAQAVAEALGLLAAAPM